MQSSRASLSRVTLPDCALKKAEALGFAISDAWTGPAVSPRAVSVSAVPQRQKLGCFASQRKCVLPLDASASSKLSKNRQAAMSLKGRAPKGASSSSPLLKSEEAAAFVPSSSERKKSLSQAVSTSQKKTAGSGRGFKAAEVAASSALRSRVGRKTGFALAEEARAYSSSSTEANSVGEASVTSGCGECRSVNCECLRAATQGTEPCATSLQIRRPQSSAGKKGDNPALEEEKLIALNDSTSTPLECNGQAQLQKTPRREGEKEQAEKEPGGEGNEEEQEVEEVVWNELDLQSQPSKGSRLSSNEAFLPDGELNLAVFKVFACRHRHSAAHDKKYCPFYHNFRDKRRFPVTYRAEQCEEHFDVDSSSLRCSKGDNCKKCHNRHELLYHPSIFKQRFCSSYAANNATERCSRGQFCAFAHSRKEVRAPLFDVQDETNPSREFFIAHFKTIWCPYGVQHDWYTCVYAHTYQDCRRDPRVGYGSEPCPMWEKDVHSADYNKRCANGTLCPYSHGSKEQLYHPSYYKTMPCMDFRAKEGTGSGVCPRGVLCAFYHQASERRVPSKSTVDYSRPLRPQQTALLQPLFLKPPLFNLDDFEAFGHSSRKGIGDKGGGGVWTGNGSSGGRVGESTCAGVNISKKGSAAKRVSEGLAVVCAVQGGSGVLNNGSYLANPTSRQRGGGTQRRCFGSQGVAPFSPREAGGGTQLHDLRVRLQLQQRRETDGMVDGMVEDGGGGLFMAGGVGDTTLSGRSSSSLKSALLAGSNPQQQHRHSLLSEESLSKHASNAHSLSTLFSSEAPWEPWHPQPRIAATNEFFEPQSEVPNFGAAVPSLREQVEHQLHLRQQQQQPHQQQQPPHYFTHHHARSLPLAEEATLHCQGFAGMMGAEEPPAYALGCTGSSFLEAGEALPSVHSLGIDFGGGSNFASLWRLPPTQQQVSSLPFSSSSPSDPGLPLSNGSSSAASSGSLSRRRPYLKLFGTNAMWAPREGEESSSVSSFLPTASAVRQTGTELSAAFGGSRELPLGDQQGLGGEEQLPSLSLSSLHWLVNAPSNSALHRNEENFRFTSRGGGESRECSSGEGQLLQLPDFEEERMFAVVPDLRRLLSATVSEEADVCSLSEDAPVDPSLQQHLRGSDVAAVEAAVSASSSSACCSSVSNNNNNSNNNNSSNDKNELSLQNASGSPSAFSLLRQWIPISASEWTLSTRLWVKAVGATNAVLVPSSDMTAIVDARNVSVANSSSSSLKSSSAATALVVSRQAFSEKGLAAFNALAMRGAVEEKGLLTCVGLATEGLTASDENSTEKALLCLLPPPGGERAVSVQRLSDLLSKDESVSSLAPEGVCLKSVLWRGGEGEDEGEGASREDDEQKIKVSLRRRPAQELRNLLSQLCEAAASAHASVVRVRAALKEDAPQQRVSMELSPEDVFVFAVETRQNGGLQLRVAVDVSSQRFLKAAVGESLKANSSEEGGAAERQTHLSPVSAKDESVFSTGQAAAEGASLGVSLAALFEEVLQFRVGAPCLSPGEEVVQCEEAEEEGFLKSPMETHLLQTLRLASAASLSNCADHPFFWSSGERLGFLEAALSLFREERMQCRAWGMQVSGLLESVFFTKSSWLFKKARASRKEREGEAAEEEDGREAREESPALELLDLVSELRLRWLYFSSRLTHTEVTRLLREVGVVPKHSRNQLVCHEGRAAHHRGPGDKALLQLLEYAEDVIDCHLEVEAPQLLIEIYSAVRSAPAILEALLADPGLASLRHRLASL